MHSILRLKSFVAILAFCVCSALQLTSTDPIYIEDTERFPGWKGELPRAEQFGPSVGFGESGREDWRGIVEQVSWSPRAFLYRGFLSDKECDALIQGVSSQMTNSSVIDSVTGELKTSTVRTSTGAFYGRGSSELIKQLERRISYISFIPVENGEGLQILHYQAGQEYKPHEDYFHDPINAVPERGGQRMATVLMYLTTPEEGGETVFPRADRSVTGSQWSECAKKGLAIKATRGDALLFYSQKPDGTNDPASMHGSCPTTKGEKWSATKWLHVGGYGASSMLARAGRNECFDADDRCGEWAALDECRKNKPYMQKYCRATCNACVSNSPESKGTETV